MIAEIKRYLAPRRVVPAAFMAAGLAGAASDADAQNRDLTMICQGGGSMVVEVSPAFNNASQVVLVLRAVMSDVAPDQPPTAGQCATGDTKLRESIQRAWTDEPGRQRTPPAMIRMSTRQSLILAVEVQADQSPRVTLAARPADARAEQAMQLYQAAIQGRTFSVTLRPVARRPLEYEIVGSSIRQ
ncbi:MAG: hypothetical protein JNL66_10535 [Alphaproteobacteria bacterium]|nr:hypothetical protein [Alphaproteobacteria bacterium]